MALALGVPGYETTPGRGQIGAIVRLDEHTIRRWLMRDLTEGSDGLADAPRPGKPAKGTPTVHERLLQLDRRHKRRPEIAELLQALLERWCCCTCQPRVRG